MKVANRETGRLGENLAANALREKGYRILERNFSNKFGEIDIIAKDEDVLVFVEVKTKKGEEFGLPEEMVNPAKLHKIRNMAMLYTSGPACRQAGAPFLCRLDVVAIVLSPTDEVLRLTHYENVY